MTLLMAAITYALVLNIGGVISLKNAILLSWPIGLLSVFLLYSLVMVLRIVRWHLLLVEKVARWSTLTKAAYIAWAQNGILPARLGEASRLYYLKTSDNVSLSAATSSIILEKFFDFFGLLLAMLLISISLPSTYGENGTFELGLTLLSILVGIGIIGMMSIFLFDEFYLNLLSKLPFKRRTTRLFKIFKESIQAFGRKPQKVVLIILLSLLQWIIESLTIYFVAFSLGYKISPIVLIFAALVGYATYLFPITPGSLGTFEFFVGTVISSLGQMSLQDALSIPFLTHILIIAYLAIGGLIAAVLGPTNRSSDIDPSEK